MNKSLQEVLDYAEECLSHASHIQKSSHEPGEPMWPKAADYWQRQSTAASALAIAVAFSSAVQYDAKH